MTDSTYVQNFENFFSTKCKRELEKLAEFYPEERSFDLDYKLLEEHDTELADELVQKPFTIVSSAEEAIKQMNILNSKGEPIAPHVRFFNLPSDHNIIVRNLNASHINKFVAVDGVVTKISDVRPKLVNAVFECKHCGRIYKIPQNDSTEKITEPGACSCERRAFNLLIEQSEFIDYQRMEIQEPIEIARGGDQTRKIAVNMTDDLTNKIIPGDKITLSGTFMLNPPEYKKSIYDVFIEANNVMKIEKEFEELELTKEEEDEIKELSNDPKLYEKLIKSVAPSIYGHDQIKEAIALQLLGGTPRKVKSDGMKIRPDMHILLIGDPGTAKSQLLQYVSLLAPKGIYVSGKASSAAGLTASAERDELTKSGWVLKAGALVLAAGGMAMIDEFDKMSEEDRSSMHDAMETQEIRVAKAGIIATFRANCSILAAANPQYGRFDSNTDLGEQFNIPPTIISRFDLIFPIKDTIDVKRDSELVDHMLTSHHIAGMKIDKNKNEKQISEKEQRVLPTIRPELLRKYIAYARQRYSPVLTESAMKKIKDFYLDLRKMGMDSGSIPITPRYLEAIIRGSEASAKGRLSNTVELEDAERAINLMLFSLKNIGLDPTTGKIDIDILATGMSRSKVDKMRLIIRLIKEINKDHGEVEYEMLVEEAKKNKMKEEEIEDVVKQLNREGTIYSPRYGIYKPADRKE